MQHYVVLGATTTGAAVARRLLQRPNTAVHVICRNVTRARAALETGVSGIPPEFYAIDDAANSSAVEGACQNVLDRTGGECVAGLAYAIGTIPLKPLRTSSAADFEHAFAVNALGAALAVKHFASALSAGDSPGAVVLYSSVAATTGFRGHAGISMAKAAVEGFTRAAAAELAPKVRVNCIAPSLSDTALAGGLVSSDAARKAMKALHPLGRLGDADTDLASATLFLLDGSQSGWVTGQVLHVDGGRSTLR